MNSVRFLIISFTLIFVTLTCYDKVCAKPIGKQVVDNTTDIDKKYVPVYYKENSMDKYFEHFISNLRYEQSQIKLIENFQKVSVQFDIDKYFKIFNYLQTENGWVLSYFDNYSEVAGKPHIYAHKKGESVDVNGDSRYLDITNAMEHIHILNQTQGYFQFFIFGLIGDDFAKHWHSSGNIDLICSRNMMIEFLKLSDDFHNYDTELKSKISKLDYRLIFKQTERFYSFRILIYNPWIGFSEATYSVSKKFPHKIKLIEDRLLLEYHCGIMF